MSALRVPAHFWTSGAILSDSLADSEPGAAPRFRLAWDLAPISAGFSAEIEIFAPDFFGDPAARGFSPAGTAVLTRAELESYLRDMAAGGDVPGALRWEEPDEATFRSRCADLQMRFASGELRKAVPITAEIARAPLPTPIERARWLLSALASNTPGYLYGFWHGSEGMLGLTPELLFCWEMGQPLRTLALAGTAAVADSASLLNDPKERAEHAWVVHDISEKLATLGVVRASETRVVNYGRLAHLRTDLTLEIAARPPAGSVISRLHPTAALGAYPHEAGQSWLREHAAELAPRLPRGRFGAPLGWSSGREALCVVAIRGVFWSIAGRALPSGCGVVAASDPEREWQELALKRASVRRVLSL